MFQKSSNLILSVSMVAVSVFLPKVIFADYGYFTMPVDPSALSYSGTNHGINAFVDHTSPEGLNDASATTFTKYTGVAYTTSTWISLAHCGDTGAGNGNGIACYNGHEGIDFAVGSGTQVFAAASGTVQQAQWQDPNATTTGFGYFVRLSHNQYGVSTLYAHLNANATTSLVGETVPRMHWIARSGNTGVSTGTTGYHLHFQVYNGDFTVTSSTQGGNGGSQFNHGVDPFGWSAGAGQASDTWANDRPFGYMWASPFATSSVINYVSGTLATNFTAKTNQIYVIHSSFTIASSVTLTIPEGVVVKFDSPSAFLDVEGQLRVKGTASNPVYFTSIKDDSVGGDTNDDATTTSPGVGDWNYIYIGPKGSTTIAYANVRYGGQNMAPYFADIYLDGGKLTASNLTIASSADNGLRLASGTVSLVSSTISNNVNYGILADGTSTLSVTDSVFASNTIAAEVGFGQGLNFSASGNTSLIGGTRGFDMQSTVLVSQTWNKNSTMPYLFNSVTIAAGKTLTLNPGVIVKFPQVGNTLSVNGILNAQGTSTDKIYFTSINDDDVGGDTQSNGSSTPLAGDWTDIDNAVGATTTLNNVIVRYGSHNTFASVLVEGGNLTVSSSTIASSSNSGVYVEGNGNVTVGTGTIIRNNAGYGIYAGGTSLTASHITIASNTAYGLNIASGTASIVSSTIAGNGTYGVFSSLTVTSTAIWNYWNASSGPHDANNHSTGTGDNVSPYVNYTPWLMSAP